MSNADDLHAAMRPLAEALARLISAAPQQPQPEQPQPQPTPGGFQFVNQNGGEWVNGVSTMQPRFFLEDTPEARQAAQPGRMVTLSNGQKRRITDARAVYNHLLVTVEGEKLDAASGYPNKVTIDGEVAPAPMPGKRKGIVGTNLGMGQGAPDRIPGVQSTDFRFPIESEIIRAKGYGFRRFRIGGLFERFFKRQGSIEMYMGTDAKGKPYSSTSVLEVGRLCKKHGCSVLWNPFHNYGTVFGKKVGSTGGLTFDQYAQAWRAFILHVKSDPDAWAATYGFDLMNEWSGMEFDPIFKATQRVLDVCADVLDDKMIVPEGKDFSSTANWVRNNDGFTKLVDPRGPGFLEFSGHLYLDADASGYYKSGDTARAPYTPESVGVDRLAGFADWLDRNGYRGNIGETIVPGDMPRLLKGLERMLAMARDRGIDVYIFGLGDWFSDDYTTVHNLEIPRNKPTLELVKGFAVAN